MNILFICGCIEPGKDGVGDYSRILASQLIMNGYSCTIISLMDKYTNEISFETQKFMNNKIEVVRFPFVNYDNIFLSKAKCIINNINPDWISLQYVPYSFNKRGLPFQLEKILKNLRLNLKLNIMFHETWIGITRTSPFKHKLIGFFQKRIAYSLIKNLKPELITTTNRLHQLVLKKNNINSEILPLFSNIMVAKKDLEFRNEVLSMLQIVQSKIDKFRLIGVFGSIYPGAEIEVYLTNELIKYKDTDIKIAFVGFGNTDNNGLNEFNRLSKVFENQIKFVHLGILPEHKISNLLHILNIGISCTPFQHIGKSGVYAVMKMHNLEVAITNYEYLPEYDKEIKAYNQDLVKKPANLWHVSAVANQFINLINVN